MKNIPNIKSILTVMVCIFTIVLTSCKDDETFDYPGYLQNRIYLRKSFVTTAFSVEKTPVGLTSDLKIKLPVFATSPASPALEVNMAIDTTYVSKYNQENETNYGRIPAEAFDLINGKLTIPEKSYISKDSVEIKINATAFKNINAGTYIVPLVVAGTNHVNAVASSNQNVIYFKLTITEDQDNLWNSAPSDKGTLLADDRTSWTVSTTNSTFEGSTSKLFDNNLSNSLSYSITQLDPTTGFVVDMKKVYSNLNGIVMNFLYSYYCLKNVDVYTSEDNNQWTMQGNSVNSSGQWNLIFYHTVSARYIKLIVREKSSNGIFFKEFNVYTK